VRISCLLRELRKARELSLRDEGRISDGTAPRARHSGSGCQPSSRASSPWMRWPL
jgi:hypothetical protein